MNFGIANVTAITVICYLACEAVKTTKLDNKFVPIIAGALGAILGVVGYLTHMPDFPAQDALTAIAVGIVSGLSATGVYEATKVAKKDDPKKEEAEPTETEPAEPEPTENEHTEGVSGDEV